MNYLIFWHCDITETGKNMDKIKFEDRSDRAKGLIELLTNKRVSTANILYYGFLNSTEIDSEIINLYVTHPNCPSSMLRRCIQIAATDDGLMLSTVTSIFSKFKKFDARFWNSISGDIDEKNVRRFVMAQNKLLSYNKWIDGIQLKVMFRNAFGFGIRIPHTDPLFIEYFTFIFDNKKFDKELCLTNTKFVTMPEEISTNERYTAILDALKKSKNSDTIIGWLYHMTGHDVYLSPDAKMIFCW